ncbi:MAG: methionine synthase [Nocardioides sp.]|nr:methionine synthase [Nocardioides sp.]
MTRATGVGSHPGDDQAAYDEALRVVLGLLAEDGDVGLPYLPEVPGRGAPAGMVGRTLALVRDLGVDLQPAGWRVVGESAGSGIDHRRARSLLAQDLDTLEERTQEYAGDLKVQVTGPWTLAAVVERPRGDKVLGDRGLRRDLADALAEGVRTHVADVRRRVPGAARLVVQVDEPVVGAVASGEVRTASGFHRHRTVDRPELSETLGRVLSAVDEAGGEPWVHSCAPGVPWDLVRAAGARGLLTDPGLLDGAGLDVVAAALEAGDVVGLGVVPTTGPVPGDQAVVERVERWLDMVGLDPETPGLLLTPACGLGGPGSPGQSAGDARTRLTRVRDAARSLR